MGHKKTIYSRVEKISILDYTNTMKNTTNNYFSFGEIKELESYTDQTWAGFLAVKRALIHLCNILIDLDKNLLTELSFELTHKKNCAPKLSVLPEIVEKNSVYTKNNFHISITHNRLNAFGLACIQE